MPGEPHETRVEESDPSGDSAAGLAGDLGVSSERTGPVRGQPGEATHGAEETYPATGEADESDEPDEAEVPPQQSADG